MGISSGVFNVSGRDDVVHDRGHDHDGGDAVAAAHVHVRVRKSARILHSLQNTLDANRRDNHDSAYPNVSHDPAVREGKQVPHARNVYQRPLLAASHKLLLDVVRYRFVPGHKHRV